MGSVHAAAIDAVAGAELVAVADTDESRTGKLAAEHKLYRCFTDYCGLLKLSEVDAVVIATPDALHQEPAVAVAEAGSISIDPPAHRPYNPPLAAELCS